MVAFTSDAYEEIMYEKILAHANCVIELDMNYPEQEFISAIEIVTYADGENVAIECTKCNEVIIDFNRPEKTQTPQRKITENE